MFGFHTNICISVLNKNRTHVTRNFYCSPSLQPPYKIFMKYIYNVRVCTRVKMCLLRFVLHIFSGVSAYICNFVFAVYDCSEPRQILPITSFRLVHGKRRFLLLLLAVISKLICKAEFNARFRYSGLRVVYFDLVDCPVYQCVLRGAAKHNTIASQYSCTSLVRVACYRYAVIVLTCCWANG